MLWLFHFYFKGATSLEDLRARTNYPLQCKVQLVFVADKFNHSIIEFLFFEVLFLFWSFYVNVGYRFCFPDISEASHITCAVQANKSAFPWFDRVLWQHQLLLVSQSCWFGSLALPLSVCLLILAEILFRISDTLHFLFQLFKASEKVKASDQAICYFVDAGWRSSVPFHGVDNSSIEIEADIIGKHFFEGGILSLNFPFVFDVKYFAIGEGLHSNIPHVIISYRGTHPFLH